MSETGATDTTTAFIARWEPSGGKERAIREAEEIMFRCLERGLAFKTIKGNLITLRPALVITRQELDWALDVLDEAIEDVERDLNR